MYQLQLCSDTLALSMSCVCVIGRSIAVYRVIFSYDLEENVELMFTWVLIRVCPLSEADSTAHVRETP